MKSERERESEKNRGRSNGKCCEQTAATYRVCTPTMILSYTHCSGLTLRHVNYLSAVYRYTFPLLEYSSCYTPPHKCSCSFPHLRQVQTHSSFVSFFFCLFVLTHSHLFFSSYIFYSAHPFRYLTVFS